MAAINSKIEGVDVLGVVTAGETIYVGRATSAQHGIVKPAATDFLFDSQTNALLVKLGVGLKRTDDGIAIAIYAGNVVTDVIAIAEGLEIKYTDIDEETENSKVIPWSEFTAAEIEYLKKYFNIEPGTGDGAVQQIGAEATGPHSAAFGKETQAEQSASFAAGTKTQAGKTLEEYIAAGGKAEDYAKSYAAAAVFGDGNKAKGYADFAAGNANESDGTSNTTVGGANKVKGTRNFTGGEANEVGQSGSSDVGNALTFGQHLKNTGRWNRVTFGQFNADDLAALFEIGNGTSDTNRVNIFVIKDNGAVYSGKLGKIHQGTRFQVSDGNSESDRRALIDIRHNGVTHIESYMSTLNGSVGNGNKVASSESGELKDIADPTDGNYPSLNTFLAGQGLQNKGRFNQVIVGQFNEFDALALFQVGTGNSDTDRKKGFRVDYAGRAESDTAAAGDDFYVRVADLGYDINFPFGGPTEVRCDNTDGITVTGTMRIYLNQAKTVFHDVPNVSVEIPIFAGKNVTIDADETNKKAVVKASDIDVNTLIPLLLSSNGIKITKNEAGDRLLIGISRLGFELGTFEANGDGIKFAYNNGIAEQIYLGASLGGAIDIYNSLVSIDNYIRVKATADEYIEINNEDVIYHTASGVKHYLREDTVKTIGGQSIYGSGDIPVGGDIPSNINTFTEVSNVLTLTASDTMHTLGAKIVALGQSVIRVTSNDVARAQVDRIMGNPVTTGPPSSYCDYWFKVLSEHLIYVFFGYGVEYGLINYLYNSSQNTQGQWSMCPRWMPIDPSEIEASIADPLTLVNGLNIGTLGGEGEQPLYLKLTTSGIAYMVGSSAVSNALFSGGPIGNVKTLFGNQQSIYGSGNIDLYRHTVWFTGVSGSSTIADCVLTFISSSNTAIDSLTSLFSVINPMVSSGGTYPANGRVYNTTNSKYYTATRIYPTSDGAVIAHIIEEEKWFAWNTLGTLTFHDKVTTV